MAAVRDRPAADESRVAWAHRDRVASVRGSDRGRQQTTTGILSVTVGIVTFTRLSAVAVRFLARQAWLGSAPTPSRSRPAKVDGT